jgi:hypothetical protein
MRARRCGYGKSDAHWAMSTRVAFGVSPASGVMAPIQRGECVKMTHLGRPAGLGGARLKTRVTLDAAACSGMARGISHLTKPSGSARVCADEDFPPIPVATEEDRRGSMRPLRRQAEALHHPVRSLPDQQPGAVPKAGRHSALAQGQARPSPQGAAANPGPREQLKQAGGAQTSRAGAGPLGDRAGRGENEGCIR